MMVGADDDENGRRRRRRRGGTTVLSSSSPSLPQPKSIISPDHTFPFLNHRKVDEAKRGEAAKGGDYGMVSIEEEHDKLWCVWREK